MTPSDLPDALAVGRLPAPGDNVAIAVRRLEAGERLVFPDGAGGPEAMARELPHTVLEGHRFVLRRISAGEALLSWGFPFGIALRDLSPGEYVCNESMLKALAIRNLQASLPEGPSFADRIEPFHFDPEAIRPAPAVPRVPAPRDFLGFQRPGNRGVGTRNVIVLLGTTSRTASYARALAERLKPLARLHPGLDGIVPVAHTEGDGPGEPHNRAEILRALAGFIVHPNVAAVLAVDRGAGPITNAVLRAFMIEHGYPLEAVPHRFLTVAGSFAQALEEGERTVRAWLPGVAHAQRTREPLSGLRVALQCGGSDAFSGISGNPLAGAVAHEVVRHGGSANLCETDELVGAQAYLLQNVRDAVVARALVGRIESFQDRLAWHGTTAESNPSGGNKLRGLYNIVLKSLGAAHKKDPRTRIDFVIDYACRMTEPGFHFMNSPGNDLEGIAGQVAAGCNLLLFVTGNGSVTNFPFMPTLKITTTTRRHELLSRDMDVNAGRYLDGEPMDALAAETFETVLATASGRRTRGELAGHSQVSLWRNWRQTDTSHLAEIKARPAPDGRPLIEPENCPAGAPAPEVGLELFRTASGWATDQVGLVLPTSLCAAQIARMAAQRLGADGLGPSAGVSRFVGLAHTEGCGFGGETMYELLLRTYTGYAVHPNVAAALLLEHGCEKVPNDLMRRRFAEAGLAAERFGWASVQLDGGIDRVLDKVERWFAERLGRGAPPRRESADWGALRLGLVSRVEVGSGTAESLAEVVGTVVRHGGIVLVPEGDPLFSNARFRERLGLAAVRASLAYGQPALRAGLHAVRTESDHGVENLTGLGGCGAHLFLAVVGGEPQQGHPMLASIQVAEARWRGVLPADDIDLFLSGEPDRDRTDLLRALGDVASGRRRAAADAQGFVDFQLTRGLLGVST